MAEQSQAPHILLTRPLVQSQRFARSLRVAAGQPLRITISPLMQAVFLSWDVPDVPSALIFSSETGVVAYARRPIAGVVHAFCVGDATARVARKAGLQAVSARGDADDLIGLIRQHHGGGGLLHVRGADARGNIAQRLTAVGLACDERVVYEQQVRPLSPAALWLLSGQMPVVLPLFSPRSAMLLAQAGPVIAPLLIVAMSQAVADAATFPTCSSMRLALAPTAPAMCAAVVESLTSA